MKKAEVLETGDPRECLADCLRSWVGTGKPKTRVSFELDSDMTVQQEFKGVVGMQIFGLASLVGELAAQYDKDPLDIAVEAGLMARLIQDEKDLIGRKLIDDEPETLTIKFKEEEQNDE